MKIIGVLLFFIYLNGHVFAQQIPKQHDALLLEYYQNQRFADAADYLKKTYPEPVTDLKILSRLAYTAQMAARLSEADDYYRRIYAVDTTNTAILFNLGTINARRGDYMKALNYYKKILLRDSTNFDVYKQMGNLSRNSGAISDAIYYFQRANKLNPREPEVAYDLTSFYLNLKLYYKADTVVTFALQADTTNLLLLLAKAQTNYRLDKFPETVVVCNKLMRAGNQISMVISMLGTSYFTLKDYNNCIGTFKLLEEGNTANETSYYYTAMSYKVLGNQVMAITYLNKAIKEAIPVNVDSYYSEMGDSYDHLHQLKNAINAYQKSMLYAAKPITWYALANLYDTELKNKTFALRYYKKYLNSNPPERQRLYMDYSKKRINELAR